MGYRFNNVDDGVLAGGDNYNYKTCTNIARVGPDFKPLGVFWYDNYFLGGSIRMHVRGFAPNWLNREFLWLAFDYPFNQLFVPKVLGFIRGDNEEVTKFSTKLGFKPVAWVDDVFPNYVPLIILELHKSDCKWLDYSPRTIKRNERQQQRPHAPEL